MLFIVDEMIGQVISIMKTQSVPYTAMFTALQPSRVSCVYLLANNQNCFLKAMHNNELQMVGN